MKTMKKDPGLDAMDDPRQTGIRIEIMRYLALAIFIALGGRLWYLQVMNSGVFAEQAEQNRIRVLPIPARRGTIFDRHGRELVTSRESYNIVISRKDVRNLAEITDLLVENLGIERVWLEKRFRDAQYEAKWESIVVKEMAGVEDVAWVEAHQYEHPELRAEEAPQRVYRYNNLAAHALGYVGEVSPQELKKGNFSKENGYKLGDIIGKFGLERYYNEILTGRDGARRVIVDSKGRIQQEIERVDPIPGRDLYSTLDLDVQMAVEEQVKTMPTGRGAIVVADPRNGEILAMASGPSFDPNLFSQRAKTPEGKSEIRDLYEDPDKPLYNRVIQGQFPPGSTWKLMTSVAALNEGVITPANSRVQDGSIQLGNRVMRSLSNYGAPDVETAIARSADGYYYRLGLKMGGERFEKWVHIFRFGERTGIDLPNERAGRPPTPGEKVQFYTAVRNRYKREREAKGGVWTERDDLEYERMGRWTDYDMAASSFGQGRNESTPIQLLRYVALLAMGGEAHTPHLLLRAVPGIDRFGEMHPEIRYVDNNRFTVPMSDEVRDIVKRAMWQAVNGAGTAGAARVEGFDVSGKTGTAQVASTERVGSKNKDHAWFMSFAPRDNPEICSVVLTENVGFGGRHSAPRAKAIYEDYYRRTRNVPEETVAEAGMKNEER
ncbi:MAG: penicillin-binding protein 2 [Acidobacteria bacterium]|nr:penicillin-binding protein 2 [Acidobacteriota bacterium]MCW5971230.1 penicillin-binding protein 2 [Blastocatellales bacterium]